MNNVSIIIPTYNEAENIEKLIGALESQKGDYKIIIVDDSSPDGTAKIVNKLSLNSHNILLNCRPGKLGLGSAVYDGMRLALSSPDCQYIVTMDADLSHDPNDVPRLLLAVYGEDVDMVQGSRYIEGGQIVGWNVFRRLQSRIANWLCMVLFGLPNEVTTYFRVYSRKCAEILVNNVAAANYEFAVTTALVIKDHGLKTIEVPIVFVNRTQGKSKLKASNILAWFALICKMFLLRRVLRGREKVSN